LGKRLEKFALASEPSKTNGLKRDILMRAREGSSVHRSICREARGLTLGRTLNC
jgi:hypothetical protein